MTLTLATLSALELPAASEGATVPDWVHLVPRGVFRASDGRGPWRYDDGAALIRDSFAARQRIHIDLNHSTETAAKLGLEAPAVGYVTEMEERPDGIWARVDWTKRGQELLSDRAYWGISPVINFDKATGVVRSVARAALTNDPAVAALEPLSMKETDMFRSKVAKALGLPEEATEEETLAALQAKLATQAEPQAALSQVGAALGLTGDVTLTQLVATATGLTAATGDQTAALSALQAKVTGLEEGNKKKAAEDFVDGAIRDLRAGVSTARDTYVALHMDNPAQAETLIASLPKLGRTHTTDLPPGGDVSSTAALSAEQANVAAILGLDPDVMAKTVKSEAQEAL